MGKPTIMTPNPSILADQNLDKNRPEKKKDKEQEKRKHWNRKEKDRKKKTFETSATRSNVKLPGKLPRNPNYSQVTCYNYNQKSHHTKDYSEPKK